MDLLIEQNEMALWADRFLYALPAKKGVLVEGGKYAIRSKKHGCLGTVVCTKVYQKTLAEIRQTESELLIGNAHFIDHEQKTKKALKMDGYYIGVFYFLKRSAEGFNLILEDKLPQMGIVRTEIQSLFK